MIRALWLALALATTGAQADTIRIASFNAELHRDGPGLLLRDIRSGKDAQVEAVLEVIAATDPDILALQGVDWDLESRALGALAERLAEAGTAYPHRVARQPNSGLATELDLDGDGRTGGPGDSQGWGEFTGRNGIALLSKYPIETDAIRDFSELLWRDLPGAMLPQRDGAPFPSPAAQAAQRLSSTGHWVVPIDLPGGRLHLLTFQAGPPVFDGPEDRNGLRNRDEIRFWPVFLDGAFGPPPESRFVIAGGANLDPWDSDGHGASIRDLLADPRLQDPRPQSPGAAQAGSQGHRTPDALDTVDWPRPGRMRVDYVLPSADWTVAAAGVVWPAPGEPGHDAAIRASRHRLVWVDLRVD
ncbi:Endonuclease/Exonuclease/phosphatase family protein [Cribrihabitans marinus]|uniref:Endonuclease/Exonuclease/phosphatase family protein n=1 Tax=Cribrihabitans marinus TaxID=1227549 RepID=A0A1H7BX44_9RHOB|nr:endonuclease/exonuclease/phosphatase family protein [Cribrihabitans marinus]GGH33391.1 hypothetical protein GCM10010973_25460 [Cribrihabitans marinus]SEJ82031.1 Endonuclease/Exonuclease/phosphatase family protein [Cribrihabitans marinus]